MEPSQAGIDDKILALIKEQAASWVREQKVVGAEILILKERKTVFHEVFGWKDRERGVPMEKNSIFRIRSMTKPIVGTAVLMLADQGKLKLTDPVARYLPSFDNPRSKSITITQLLHHSGGFSDPGYPKSLNDYKNLREAVDALGIKGPETKSGTSFVYSDGGSATLGALVAEVSGMPVEGFIEEYLLEPLRMDDTLTYLSLEDPRRSRVSSTYETREDDEGFHKYWDSTKPQKLPFFRASGGIYSTPVDYAKFLAVWMDKGSAEGVRFISPETVDAAFSPGIIPQYGMHWNLLWEDSDQDDRKSARTLSGFGHLGSDGTLAFAFPKKDIMILYFSQSRGGSTSMDFLKLAREHLID
jgi:CubicO group peptidase (beta-lactamase class C family)